MAIQQRNSEMVELLSADFLNKKMPYSIIGNFGGIGALELNNVADTTITILDSTVLGTVDILHFTSDVISSDNNSVSLSGILAISESVNLYNDGSSILQLRLTSGGSVEIQRTAGTDEFDVKLSISWVVGHTLLSNVLTLIADRLQARDDSGIGIYDDGGNLGVFVEDGGFVGVRTNLPTVALQVAGNAIVGDGSTSAFIVIDGAAATSRQVGFRTAGSNRWLYNVNATAESGSNAGSDFQLLSRTDAGAALSTPFHITRSTGYVGINDTTPDGQLDVRQSSTTAAVPTLELEQADLSEEFINFVGTVGTGNSIEAVGAKILTTTHFIRVQIEGVGYRYIPLGTIA